MKSLTLALIYSVETEDQIRRCYNSLVFQLEHFSQPLNRVDWILICAPAAHTKKTDFFKGQVILSETNNLAKNRNKALDFAQTDFLYFTDPDCWATDSILEYLMKRLDSYEQDDSVLAAAGPNLLNSNRPELNKFFSFIGRMRWLNGQLSQIHIPNKDRFDWHSPTCNILYNLKQLGKTRFSHSYSRVGEDLEFHFRLSQKNKRILICSQAPVWHEQRGSFFNYLKKVYHYGTAQTQLLKHHPRSIVNKRLYILYAGLLVLIIATQLKGAVLLFTLATLSSALFLFLALEFFNCKSERPHWLYSFGYLLLLFSYGAGQAFGLLIPRPNVRNASAT